MKQKGMMFYYDWITPFSMLEPEEFKALVLAMLRFQAYDSKPPSFKGTAGIVAQFVFPQLERAKTNSENGRKGALALHKQD